MLYYITFLISSLLSEYFDYIDYYPAKNSTFLLLICNFVSKGPLFVSSNKQYYFYLLLPEIHKNQTSTKMLDFNQK
jgi:hypothetical protein